MYRKVLAGIVLAISVSLTYLSSPAKADTEEQVGELTIDRLLSGQLSPSTGEVRLRERGFAITPEPLVPEIIVADTAEPEAIEPDIIGSEAIANTPVYNLSTADMLEPERLVPAVAQQVPPTLAQSSSPGGDTFAPLTEEEVRQQLLIDPDADTSRQLRPLPASTFLVPTAYGADWGDFFVGIAGNTNGNTAKFDGSASLGFGVGSATDFVGLEISSSIISLDGFADDGTLGFKLHRVFPSAGNLGIAVGWENPVKWGAASDEEETYYGVVSNRIDLRRGQVNPLPMTVSVGVGTGAYRSAGAVTAGDNDPNLFGSISLRVQPELSVISSWTGRSLGIAASAAPFKNPFVFTVGLSDITDNTPEGIRLNASVGYGYTF